MKSIVDSYIAMKTASHEDAYTPVHKDVDLDKYSFLMGYFDNEKHEGYIYNVFKLFEGCHLTAHGTTDLPGVKITRIIDEKGAFDTVVMDDVPYGVFIRNDLPQWIIQILNELAFMFVYTFGDAAGKVTIPIEVVEHFNSWLGEEPNRLAFVDDVVLCVLSKEEIEQHLKLVDPSWEIPESMIVPLMIYDITAESITLVPKYNLGRLIPFQYPMEMTAFKQFVMHKDIVLISVTTDSK